MRKSMSKSIITREEDEYKEWRKEQMKGDDNAKVIVRNN